MRKIFNVKDFILSSFVVLFIAFLTLLAYNEPSDAGVQDKEASKTVSSDGTGEMIWDQVSRRFGTFVSF